MLSNCDVTKYSQTKGVEKKIVKLHGVKKKLLNKTNKKVKKLNLRLDRIHSSILDANKYL